MSFFGISRLGFIPFWFHWFKALMPMTAFDGNTIPRQSFSVPGSGRRLEGWDPASPPARAAKLAIAVSGGGRETLVLRWAAGT